MGVGGKFSGVLALSGPIYCIFANFQNFTRPRKRQLVGQAEKGREARKMPETHKLMPLSALGPRVFGLFFEFVGPFKGVFSSKGFV